MNSLEIAVKYGSMTALDLWPKFVEFHSLLPDEIFDLRTELIIRASEFKQQLKKRNAQEFEVSFGRAELHGPADIASYQLTRIDLKRVCENIATCKEWMAPFLVDSRLIQARLYNDDFDYWQNAFDPLQFESANMDYSKLPTRSNGLPFPLAKTIIDTSSNPGRAVLRDGFIESIGSTMWLSREFFRRTGASVEKISKLANVTLLGDVYEITAYDQVFSSANGEQALIQNNLRALLYPR